MLDKDDESTGFKLTDRATMALLSVLDAEGEKTTQRGLAQRIGVALGLTNSLLKRAMHKGLVKVQQAPAKRYAYYVTPRGFKEKSRLVAQYLSTSLEFFRQAREEYAALYGEMNAQARRGIVLYGAGELAEIALISAQAENIEILGVIEPGANFGKFFDLPVMPSIQSALDMGFEAVVITSSDAPQDAYNSLRQEVADAKIFATPFMHISRNTKNGGAR